MARSLSLILAVFLSASSSGLLHGQHQHDVHSEEPERHQTPHAPGAEASTQLELPPRLRSLLVQEMVAILDATQQILAAIVRGDDQTVARHAQAIHDSFILAQELSAKESEQLHKLAPEDFLIRDQALHQLSDRLAEAARQGDQQRQRVLFAEMTEACVACHARYAAERFPQLKINSYTPKPVGEPVPHGH